MGIAHSVSLVDFWGFQAIWPLAWPWEHVVNRPVSAARHCTFADILQREAGRSEEVAGRQMEMFQMLCTYRDGRGIEETILLSIILTLTFPHAQKWGEFVFSRWHCWDLQKHMAKKWYSSQDMNFLHPRWTLGNRLLLFYVMYNYCYAAEYIISDRTERSTMLSLLSPHQSDGSLIGFCLRGSPCLFVFSPRRTANWSPYSKSLLAPSPSIHITLML